MHPGGLQARTRG